MPSITCQMEFDRLLGQQLVEQGEISAAGHREALTEQMVSGGTLSLNLWELGLLGIDALTRIGAQLFDSDAVLLDQAKAAEPAACALLSRSFVRRSALLPLRCDAQTLCIATAQPWRLDLLDEAAARAGRAVRTHYMCDVGILRLLHQHYEILPPPRYRITPMRQPERKIDGRPHPEREVEPIGELTTEEEFLRLYASELRDPGDHDGKQVAGNSSWESGEDCDDDESEIELSELLEPETLSLSQLSAIPIMTAAEAIGALERAETRLELGDVLVRFGLSFSPRVALFTCRRDVWIGWTGVGPGIDPERMPELMVPVVAGTIFGLVHQGGAPLLGPLPPHPIHRAFAKAMGARPESSVGLFPVRHRGRVLFVIYLDGGSSGILDVSEILILAQRVPLILERMVQRSV